jgi:hypothetical protein
MSIDLLKNAEELGGVSRDVIQDALNKQSRDTSFHGFYFRKNFNRIFGWSVPCKEAIDIIKKYARSPVYDVMAGTGYWSRILNKAGIDVRPSDMHKILSKNHYHKKSEDFDKKEDPKSSPRTYIRRRNALRVGFDIKNRRIKGDIFLSWPPYQCSVASDLLDMLPLGTRVFYIGEGQGGCTGDLAFHKNLESNFKLLDSVELPTFLGIHDGLDVYEKEKENKIDAKYRGAVWDSYD